MELDKIELLKRLYHEPDSPACYAGKDKLLKEAKKIDPNITKRDVNYFLEGDRTYTLHKPRRIHFRRSKVIPAGFMTDVQVDLADFQKLSRNNKGYKYILVGIDVLSKRVFTAPVKSKKFNDMKKAFEILFEQMPMKPHSIFSDRGKEFLNSDMRRYLEDLEIHQKNARTSTIKAALAERCIRTLKQRLYRYFSQKHTLNWENILPKITNALNNTKSRVTGKKPVEITPENAQEIWLKNYGKEFEEPYKRAKYNVGDFVRLAKDKTVFTKGYLPNYTDEIFHIYDIKRGKPNRYGLKDDEEEAFDTRFYEEDLVKTRKDAETTYRIEKVLRTRVKNGDKEHLVKFIGYKQPEWIKDSDIER